jgi:hypothetical protein
VAGHLSPGSISSNGGANAEEEVRLLEETLRTRALDGGERAVAEATIAATRQRGLRLRAREAVADGLPDARSRALALVTGAGFAPRTRLKAALAVASPRLAHRLFIAGGKKSAIQQRFGDHPGSS